MLKFKLIWIIIAIVCATLDIYAQGGHYWTEQYGTRSILLSNSIIGGTEDLGTVFYNPGRLAVIENAAFLLSAKVYELKSLKIENIADDGVDLNNSEFGGAPSLAAGTFKIPKLEGHHFAYAFLTRQNLNNTFFTQTEKQGDIIEDLPGEELFTGSIELSTSFNEEWMGGTWSYALSDVLSVGVSGFFTTTSSSKGIDLRFNALSLDNNSVAQSSKLRQMNFSQNGLVWKFGAAINLEKMVIGITATTPKVKLRSSGDFTFEDYLSGIPDSIAAGRFISSVQTDLNVTHKSPFSFGLGTTFHLGNHNLHFSAEYFSKIKKYSILSAQPFTDHIGGDTINFSLVDEAKQVLNFGIGVEFNFKESLSAYGSFSTDYSFVNPSSETFASLDSEAFNSTFEANIIHMGAGIVFKIKNADFTLGTTYAFANETLQRPVDFPDEGDNGVVTDPTETSNAKWSRWRFILSFSIPFADKLSKSLDQEETQK